MPNYGSPKTKIYIYIYMNFQKTRNKNKIIRNNYTNTLRFFLTYY